MPVVCVSRGRFEPDRFSGRGEGHRGVSRVPGACDSGTQAPFLLPRRARARSPISASGGRLQTQQMETLAAMLAPRPILESTGVTERPQSTTLTERRTDHVG